MSNRGIYTGSEEFCWNQRTRDRSRDNEPEVTVPKTATERAADFYFEKHMLEEAAKKQEQQRAETTARELRLKQQAARDAANKKAAFKMQEHLIEDTIARYGLTPTEKASVMETLLDTSFTSERCEILCAEIVVRRPQPRVTPWGYEEDFEE